MLYRCNDIAKGANMSIVTLFHGSNHIIKKPELRLGKETNDYGQGFYCTELPEMAKEWDYQLNGDLGPEDVFPSSNREVWWKCSNGHSWRASPNQRSVGQGCPFCDGKTPQRRRLI